MEITATNFELTDHYLAPGNEPRLEFIYPALQEFKKIKTSVPVAHNVVKSIGSVEKALADFNSTRTVICEQLCERDAKGECVKEGGKYKLSVENQIEFNIKFRELLNTEIKLDIFPINQSEISAIKEINIACYETLLRHGFIMEDAIPSLNGKATKMELEAIGQ